MGTSRKKNVVFELEDGFDFSPDRVSKIIEDNHQYLTSYDCLVKLSKSNLPEDVLYVSLAHAVYGWMPTILKSYRELPLRKEEFPSLEHIRRLDNEKAVVEFIKNLKEPILNNSWVRTSKFLHFLDPEFFPIWDSRVVQRFGGYTPYQMTRKDNYIGCVEFMLDQKDMVDGNALADAIKKKFKYRPTNLRCLELEFFTKL